MLISMNAMRLYRKQKIKSTCLCDKPYNPDDTSSMHFCPRKKCNKAYHASCLKKGKYVQKILPAPLPTLRTNSQDEQDQSSKRGIHLHTPPKTPSNSNSNQSDQGRNRRTTSNASTGAPRFLQFERTLPNTTLRDSKKVIPPDLIDLSMIPSSPISPINASVSQTSPVRTSSSKKQQDRLTITRYKLVPPAVLALARSPMVRGDPGKTGLDREMGCVTGNVAFVARARNIVERVVWGREPLGEEDAWMKELGLPSKENADENSKTTTNSKEEVMRWVVQDKGFLCPSCGGVI